MDDAQLHLSCDDWPTVEFVVRVLPAGVAHVPFIDALVRLEEVRNACLDQVIDTPAFLSALAGLQAPVRDIVQATCELLNGLQRFDVNAVCASGARLEVFSTSTALLPERTKKLLVKLAQFAHEFGRTSLHEWTLPAFFIHDDALPKYRNWWKQPSSLASSFERTYARFSAILTGDVPASLQRIREWICGFKDQAAGLYLAPASSQIESDVFRQASAFMAVSADIHHANHSHILALICLHRAVEWLLAAKCADQNLLDFTSTTGVRMRSGELLSFDALLTAFTQQGMTLNGMINDLGKLNSWRNLFAYTHHMSCPRMADARSIFTRIRSGLPGVANSSWKENVKTLSCPWPVSLEDMLDPAGEVRDTYSVHSVDSLRI
ncbi:hypothetical protein ACSBR8_27000 [Pseudomonas aeruginosa]|uniref:hypothetical protein n=1 Tax=Pseudomonas aeruginosa TaxID=287 RepID=UPI003EBB2602